jgi:hypothetical protein
MKYLGSRELTGYLDPNEEKILIENDLAGIGWKIESVKVLPFLADDFPKNGFTVKLGTDAQLDPNVLNLNRNNILACAVYGTGSVSTIVNMQDLIVDELHIVNMSLNPAFTSQACNYQVILGQYAISPEEQVVAQIKVSQG